ncbi:hypothetical protein SteCoe_33671 [Stentor coeruleus]|uniref:Uncharacterized protein n=1 Tax=Stentor coeruleus TaxID=5963 RepID=A0A1R2AW72_9CILI|nr:hypothetical protein SteCoe_33671 [Stentor coeruleus]
MYSLHQQKKQEELNIKSEKSISKKAKTKLQKRKKEALSESAYIRIQNFNKTVSPELEQIMKQGAVPLVVPSRHDFRHKGICQNIYVRKYMKQEEKISKNIEDYRSGHLESEKYFKLGEDWLRKTDCKSTSNQTHKDRIEVTACRIQRNASENACYRLEPGNGHFIKFPVFRAINKDRWTGDSDFSRFTKLLSKDQTPWKLPEPIKGEPYLESYKITENMLRKREKSKEIDETFCSTFNKDTWNKLFPRPVTNSTYVSEAKSRTFMKLSKLYPNSFETSKGNLSNLS